MAAPETAANLLRPLLALDPSGDLCGVLLRLDADLLQAGDAEAVLSLFDSPATWYPCRRPTPLTTRHVNTCRRTSRTIFPRDYCRASR